MLQIESVEGVRAVDDILHIPGIDVIFIGPYDLSQSLGIPGQTSDPRVYAAGQALVAKAAAHNVRVGVFANTDQEAYRWKEIGIQYLCYSVDTVILLHAMRNAHQRLR